MTNLYSSLLQIQYKFPFIIFQSKIKNLKKIFILKLTTITKYKHYCRRFIIK